MILLLSGPIASGKTSLAACLRDRADAIVLSTRQLLASSSPTQEDRRVLQEKGDDLDSFTGGAWIASALEQMVEPLGERKPLIVVDAVRTREQIDAVRTAFSNVTHVHLTAGLDVLHTRYAGRETGSNGELPSYDVVRSHPTESRVDGLAVTADLVFDTGEVSIEEVCRLLRMGLIW